MNRHRTSRRQFVAGTLAAGGMWLGTGCGKNDPNRREVVVYSSIDDVYARAMAEAFTTRTGIEVRLVTDTEETKSTGLLNRLIAEGNRPQADVFWSGDAMRAAILKQRGLARPILSEELKAYPDEHRDPDGQLARFSARLRVLLFHRDRVPESSRPKSIHDLAHPRFRGRSCLANPLFGTTSMHAAALFETLGESAARQFFQSLDSNDVRMLSSNGEVRRRVASGEFDLGLTDSDDASVALLDRQPVGFVLPDQDGMGTLLVPSAAVLIQSGPHPAEGQRFIDHLLSAEGEQFLADSSAAQIPLRRGLATPPMFGRPLTDLRTLNLDPDRLGRRLAELQDGFLRDWVASRMAR